MDFPNGRIPELKVNDMKVNVPDEVTEDGNPVKHLRRLWLQW